MKRIAFLLCMAVFSGCMCTTVEPGNRGVQVTLGEVNQSALAEGFHWVNPISSVNDVSVRQITKEANADSFSSDLQHVGIKLQILYRVPEAAVIPLFQKYGGDPFDTLLAPRAQEAVKEVTATMTSEMIVKSREEVKQKALELTKKKVGELLVVEDLVIENLTLSPELQQAIEQKMVQEQESAKAKFVQQKASIDADTLVIQAKGEAAAIKIRGDALRENPKVIEMRLLEKWDGRAPLVTGSGSGAGMILPLDSIKNDRK